MRINTSIDPLQVHKNGKIFLLLDSEIGAVGHIASMAILPAGALVADTILEEYRFHNSYQYDERQMFEGKICMFITS